MELSYKMFMLVLGVSVGLMTSGCAESGSAAAGEPSAPMVKSAAPAAKPKLEKTSDKDGFTTFEGMVAAKRSSGKSWSILVVQGLSENEAINSSWDELVRIAQRNHSGAFYHVSSEQYKQFQVGQRVMVTSTQQEDSNPPYRNTKELEIIQEPQMAQVTGYRDDIVVGHILSMDSKKKVISLDISDWVNRHSDGKVDAMMHSIRFPLDENTELLDALGRKVKPSGLKIGDKLELIPAKKWNYNRGNETPFLAQQVTRLTMTRAEKLDRMLAKGRGIHTVVIYEEGKTPPHDEMDFDRYVPGAFNGGISWLPYREGEAVDYKQELMLTKLPVILVFDDEDVIYQTESIRELQKWFNDRAATVMGSTAQD